MFSMWFVLFCFCSFFSVLSIVFCVFLLCFALLFAFELRIHHNKYAMQCVFGFLFSFCSARTTFFVHYCSPLCMCECVCFSVFLVNLCPTNRKRRPAAAITPRHERANFDYFFLLLIETHPFVNPGHRTHTHTHTRCAKATCVLPASKTKERQFKKILI